MKKRKLEENSKKKAASHFFKERENDGTFTNRQRNVLKSIARYSKNISKHLKNLSKHQRKSEKYGHDIGHLFSKKDNNNINAFKEARELLNERRINLLHKETNQIRRKPYKKEAAYNFLKEKEQNDSLRKSEKKVLQRIDKYFKNFKSDLEKLQKYEYNITHGLDYLFNEEDDYYIPTEVKSAFDGGYMLYESKGDKDNILALYEYFDIIRPYLKDLIDVVRLKVNGKYNYQCESFLFLSQMQMKLLKCTQKLII